MGTGGWGGGTEDGSGVPGSPGSVEYSRNLAELQDDDDRMGGRVALRCHEDSHARVKLLQGFAKVCLEGLID